MGQLVNALDFASHMVSITTIQRCYCVGAHRQYINECVCGGGVPTNLCPQEQAAGRIWPMGPTMPTAAVEKMISGITEMCCMCIFKITKYCQTETLEPLAMYKLPCFFTTWDRWNTSF